MTGGELPVLWVASSILAFCVMVGAFRPLWRGLTTGTVIDPPQWCEIALPVVFALFAGGVAEALLGL